MKIRHLMILLAACAALWTGLESRPISSRADSSTCPDIVTTAVSLTGQFCDAAGRNEACYGHGLLEAQARVYAQAFRFDQEGDVANVADIETLRLGAMDFDSGSWGVALLRLRANFASSAAGQNLTFLLFGDVEIGNQMSEAALADIAVKAADNVNIRRAPNQDAAVIGALVPNQTVTATGRLADNSWVRVINPSNGRSGWVAGWLMDGDFDQLDVVETESSYYGPMQAFYFQTGENDSACQEAPDSGLLIQTPEGVAQVTFLINEVDIQLGSTIYFQAQPAGKMAVYVVEGSAQVSAEGLTYRALAGSVIYLPLDENLVPAGPPLPPAPYDPAEVAALPISLLERKVVIAPPATPEVIEATAIPINPDAPQVQGEPSSPATEPPDVESPPTEVLPTDVPVIVEPPTEVPPTEEEQVTICHKGNTITIGISALPAHLAHGDTIGPCP